MVPLDYIALRLVRRHLPGSIVRLLLRHGLVIRAGMETSAPAAATRRFLDAIEAAGQTVTERRVLIFGYGGHFDVALELLKGGARHVVLVDPYAAPSLPRVELGLPRADDPFLERSGPRPIPNPRWITAIHAPLEQYIADGGEPADLVLSNSVLEHVDDVESTVQNLARVTTSGGQHFHFIDLRDHYFKHPFEMLCYSEEVWRRFLNPGSNLNRLRTWDYERLFSSSFRQVKVHPRLSELEVFRATRRRIRPEFLSGDEQRDAVTQILLTASL